jgi:uncharacterized protein with NRDE domain
MTELVKNSEVIRFDRHSNMDSKTRKVILDLISDIQIEIEDSFELVNSLYGLFDGYNYFFTNDFQTELAKIERTELGERIGDIYITINSYK